MTIGGGTVAEIINLNKRRKAKKKLDKEKKACENRVKHGRTKQERLQAKQEQEKAKQFLDNHKLISNDDDVNIFD